MINSQSASVGVVDESEPNDAFGVLEFCIAPPKFGHRRGPSPLTRQQIERYSEDLANNGPSASTKRDDPFIWMEAMEGVKLLGNLVIEQYDGSEYLLVHNRPPFMMSSATGWGLRSLTEDRTDNMGRPAIGFQLDWDGSDRFHSLTSANVGRSLAITIEGKVVSAPNIQSAVRGQAIITGDFTTGQIEDMTRALQKIVRPISTPATAPACKPAQRPLRTYLIPAMVFLLGVAILGFLIYR